MRQSASHEKYDLILLGFPPGQPRLVKTEQSRKTDRAHVTTGEKDVFRKLRLLRLEELTVSVRRLLLHLGQIKFNQTLLTILDKHCKDED